MSVADVYAVLKWRVGKPLDRGVWAINPKEGGDMFVAFFGNSSVAAFAVEQHNKSTEKEGFPDV